MLSALQALAYGGLALLFSGLALASPSPAEQAASPDQDHERPPLTWPVEANTAVAQDPAVQQPATTDSPPEPEPEPKREPEPEPEPDREPEPEPEPDHTEASGLILPPSEAVGERNVEDEVMLRDLHAQEQMARWSVWMGIASVLSAIFAAAAFVLMRQTLVHTRETAEAAHKNNEVVQNSYMIENRPWVSLRINVHDKPIITPKKQLFLPITITCKNIGKTPAKNLTVLAEGQVYMAGGRNLESFIKDSTTGTSQVILLPDECFSTVRSQYIDIPNAVLRSKIVTIKLNVAVLYKTTLNEGTHTSDKVASPYNTTLSKKAHTTGNTYEIAANFFPAQGELFSPTVTITNKKGHVD